MWTDTEITFIKENYPLYGGNFCAEHLNRNNRHIRRFANDMGLRSPNNKSKTTEQYLEDLLAADIDIWPVEEYITNAISILHEGMCGHIWSATPNRILAGRTKCPLCTDKVNLSVPTNLYFVSFEVDEITYYKIGISKNEPKNRFLAEWNKLNMKVEWIIKYPTGYEARSVEQQLLKDNICYKIDTGALASGNTETVSVYVSKPNGIK